MSEVLVKVAEQEVALPEPHIEKGFGITHGNALLHHEIAKGFSGVLKRLAVQLDAPECVSKPLKTETIRLALRRYQQPLYGRERKIADAHGRFEEAEACEGPIGRVSNEVENKIHHLPPGVDGPSLRCVAVERELLNGISDGATALKRELNGLQLRHGAPFSIQHYDFLLWVLLEFQLELQGFTNAFFMLIETRWTYHMHSLGLVFVKDGDFLLFDRIKM